MLLKTLVKKDLERGETQRGLALKVGVSLGTINNILAGQIPTRMSTVQKFSDYFGVRVDELFGADNGKAHTPIALPKQEQLDPMDRFWLDVTRKFERETYPPEDREMLRLMIFRLLYNAHIPIHEFWKRYNPRPEGVEIFEQKWKSDLDDFFKTMMKLKER